VLLEFGEIDWHFRLRGMRMDEGIRDPKIIGEEL